MDDARCPLTCVRVLLSGYTVLKRARRPSFIKLGNVQYDSCRIIFIPFFISLKLHIDRPGRCPRKKYYL